MDSQFESIKFNKHALKTLVSLKGLLYNLLYFWLLTINLIHTA